MPAISTLAAQFGYGLAQKGTIIQTITTFTTTGTTTWNAPTGTTSVDYLVVGGGG